MYGHKNKSTNNIRDYLLDSLFYFLVAVVFRTLLLYIKYVIKPLLLSTEKLFCVYRSLNKISCIYKKQQSYLKIIFFSIVLMSIHDASNLMYKNTWNSQVILSRLYDINDFSLSAIIYIKLTLL